MPDDPRSYDPLETPSIDAIRLAARRLAGAFSESPVLRSPALDRATGRTLYFKDESSLPTGSFKLRGAMNAVLSLDREVHAVATHSSGNHARALAHAARACGIAAHVAMPSDAAPEKIAAVQREGARVVLCEPTPEGRRLAARRLCDETGAVLVPPSDHPDVIAGQGTVALELLAQVPGLDVVVVPVGGGGLVAGVALVVASLCRQVRVVGAQPTGADDAVRSKAAGRHLPPAGPALTVADGLRAPLVARVWPVVRDLVDSIVSIEDDATMASLLLLRTHLGLAVEPSAAIALAAVLGAPSLAGRVGVVLTGGNIDLSRVAPGVV